VTRRSKLRWSDLSQRQRSAVVGAGAAQVGLLVAALADLWRRPPAQLRGSKRMWAALCLVNFVGPLAYFSFGRRR
jgi:Phospholipase_D-nuclease N-terminal